MKIVPPIALMKYISFEDGKVVATKEIPKHLKAKYKRFCMKIEKAERRRQRMRNLFEDSNAEY